MNDQDTTPKPAAPPVLDEIGVEPAYTSYAEVPWYRKNWLAITCAFLFFPALLVMLISGPIYYERGGELRTYTTGAKVFLFIWCFAQFGRIINPQH